MARLTDEDRENILADWHTGQFTQSQLGRKYKTTHVTIGKITKDIEPKFKDLVTTQIAIDTQLAGESYKEVTAVREIVTEKTKHLQFLHNITIKNVSTMAEKIDKNMTIYDHKTVQDTVHKAGQTLGVIEQFAPKMEVTNMNAQQNKETKVITVKYE